MSSAPCSLRREGVGKRREVLPSSLPSEYCTFLCSLQPLSTFLSKSLIPRLTALHSKPFIGTYSRLPITRTLANSNQNRFSPDFRHTFTVILLSITRTLDNSSVLLTRSNFRFPSGHFLHNFTHENSNQVRQYVASQNKQCK